MIIIIIANGRSLDRFRKNQTRTVSCPRGHSLGSIHAPSSCGTSDGTISYQVQPPATLTTTPPHMLVRYRVGKTTFEVVTKEGTVQKYRKGEIKSLDDVQYRLWRVYI